MVKILVSMDERLLARLDREARAHGMSRSAYLSRLTARHVGATSGPGKQVRVRRALERLSRLFAENPVPEDATSAIRAERDSR